MKTSTHAAKNKIRLLRDVRRHKELPYYTEILKGSKRLEAWKLHAETYIRNTDIDESYLDHRGVIKDEIDTYRPQSIYFGVRSHDDPGALYATGRFIMVNRGAGLKSLQFDIDDLSPTLQKRLYKLDPKKVAEPASLVKKKGAPSIVTLYLFREMLRYSMEHDIQTWVFTLNPGMQRSYEARFGHALTRLGTKMIHSGQYRHEYIPYMMDVSQVKEHFISAPKTWLQSLGHDALVDFMFGDYVAVEHDFEKATAKALPSNP